MFATYRPTDDGGKCYPYAQVRALYERGLMYARRPAPEQGRDRPEEAVEIFERWERVRTPIWLRRLWQGRAEVFA